MDTVSELNEEICHLNSKLEGMTKYVCMINYGTKTLDEILRVVKMSRGMKRIRYNYDSSKIKFVPLVKKIEFIMSDYKS